MNNATLENKVVRLALKKAGMPVHRVDRAWRRRLTVHLDFTAWHHLEHKRLPSYRPGTYTPFDPMCSPDCQNCAARKELEDKVVRVAAEFIGESTAKEISVEFLWHDTSNGREQWKRDWSF